MTDYPGQYEHERNEEQRDRLEEAHNRWLMEGGEELTPGVDYEEAGCPICGRADPDMQNHQGCMDQLGTWPEPRYGDE